MAASSRFVRRVSVAIAVMGLGICPAARAEEPPSLVLYDFGKGFDFTSVKAADAKVSEAGNEKAPAMRVVAGHKNDWPGVTLPAPRGHWDLSAYRRISMDVKNVGDKRLSVSCRVDSNTPEGPKNITTAVSIEPGQTQTLSVNLPATRGAQWKVDLFGMRGYPWGMQGKKVYDSSNVLFLIVFLSKPKENCTFEIGNIRAEGKSDVLPPEMMTPEKFFPFIDEYGQYIHKDWPGKTHSVAELAEHKAREAKDLAVRPGPADWDKYGGWKSGPTLKAAGFFYAAKHEGKWWLVDPEGKLYWSHGIDCVNAHEGCTPIAEREKWFRDLPSEKGEFKFCYSSQYALHGHYEGKSPRCFSFGKANLMRKYGEKWADEFADISHRRLRSWGLNTIANWSDRSIYMLRRTPYTANVYFGGKMLQGSKGYWGQFRDVFDPSFKEGIRKSMAKYVGKEVGDPWCMGFFVDNEIGWGDDTSLAVAALVSPADQAAKKVFLEDLKARYGTIEKLNAAWGVKHASWEALVECREAPDKKKAREDLVAFYAKTAATYFKTIRDAVKEVAPNQLYLGCRFAWVNEVATIEAAKYCDVVSFNLYRKSIAEFKFTGKADVPLIVGEFHFGALDRGMFHTGLVATESQADRARAYKNYVEGALRHPQFVGTHWFKYMDESTTGRPLDEENYQIGFLDGVDTPYVETIDASREVGAGMYHLRAGK